MLSPLTVGLHHLSFTAQLSGGFSQNIHYTLTVVH
jgi:hypothetical protein